MQSGSYAGSDGLDQYFFTGKTKQQNYLNKFNLLHSGVEDSMKLSSVIHTKDLSP